MASNPYQTKKKKAWRNIMVAAINAAIDQKLLDISPGAQISKEGVTFNFNTPLSDGKSIPGIAHIHDAGFSEVKVHAALYPTDLAASKIRASLAFSRSSIKKIAKAHAEGWLERKDGAWLQVGHCKAYVAADVVDQLELISVEPNGYSDRGPFRM